MSLLNKRWQEAGYPQEAFNEECAAFIFTNHFDQPISYYGHKIEAIEQEPVFLVEGTLTRWREFKPRINAKYTYLQSGLTPQDSHEIRPIRQEKSSGKYVFTVCNAVRNYAKPIFKEMHAYFELTCPDGKVYNFGLQSTEEIEKGGISYGFATVRGDLSCPDSNEFMGSRVTIHKTPRTILEDKGLALLEQLKIERREGLPFNWGQNNCAHFVASHGKLVGVNISINRSLLSIWLPNKFNIAGEHFLDSLPIIVKNILTVIIKILLIIPTIFLNMIAYKFLGAWRGFPQNEKRVALLCNPYDFFFKLPTLNLPYALLAWQLGERDTYIESTSRIQEALV
ncbi:MAG: hypothetical protein NTY13_04285 [Chlamydiae bacterium]|nr:hypothetical protein [Chlamydiota bacterium]